MSAVIQEKELRMRRAERTELLAEKVGISARTFRRDKKKMEKPGRVYEDRKRDSDQC